MNGLIYYKPGKRKDRVATRPVSLKAIPCPPCFGTGRSIHHDDGSRCLSCGGRGMRIVEDRPFLFFEI
jgi:hypothetical protein